jgi:glycosyltransferase involved in cell wall biosynthesis
LVPDNDLAGASEDHGRGRNLKVLIDGFFLDRPYGFGRYLRELVEALDRHAPEVDLVLAVRPEVAALAARLAPRIGVVLGPRVNPLIWEQHAIPRLARAAGASIIHSPTNTRPFFRLGARGVVTVHDLIFDRQHFFDGTLSDIAYRAYCRLCLRIIARSDDRVASVSRATAEDLLSNYGRSSKVIYNSASGFARASGSAVAPGDYFLHRGGVLPHRNTLRVARAFAASGLAASGVELRVFGLGEDSGFTRHIDVPGVRVLPRQSDAELAALYRGAIAVLALSLEEGFGLPIIEAFALGSPVIVSDRAPMNEIAGSAALLVDPTDEDAIRTSMERLYLDRQLRAKLKAAGERRAAVFDHATIARQWSALYRSAAVSVAGASPVVET